MEALNHEVLDLLSIDLIAKHGIKGDRYYDEEGSDSKRQLTFFDHAVYEELNQALCDGLLHPSKLRRNVVISDVDLNALIGKEFSIGEARFLGVEEAKPCYWMDQACAPGANDFLKGRGGLRCKILNDSQLFKGENIFEIID